MEILLMKEIKYGIEIKLKASGVKNPAQIKTVIRDSGSARLPSPTTKAPIILLLKDDFNKN